MTHVVLLTRGSEGSDLSRFLHIGGEMKARSHEVTLVTLCWLLIPSSDVTCQKSEWLQNHRTTKDGKTSHRPSSLWCYSAVINDRAKTSLLVPSHLSYSTKPASMQYKFSHRSAKAHSLQ